MKTAIIQNVKVVKLIEIKILLKFKDLNNYEYWAQILL